MQHGQPRGTPRQRGAWTWRFPSCCYSRGESAEPITRVSRQPARGRTDCKRRFFMERAVKHGYSKAPEAIHHHGDYRLSRPQQGPCITAHARGDVRRCTPAATARQERQRGRGVPFPAQDHAADSCCRWGGVLPVTACALASCPGTITVASPQQHPGPAHHTHASPRSSPQPPQHL